MKGHSARANPARTFITREARPEAQFSAPSAHALMYMCVNIGFAALLIHVGPEFTR